MVGLFANALNLNELNRRNTMNQMTLNKKVKEYL